MRSLRKAARFCPARFPMSSLAAAKSRNRSPNAPGKRSPTSASNYSMSALSAANTIQRSPRKSSSACRVSGIRSPRDSVPKAVAKPRISAAKKKAMLPRSVLLPPKMRSRSKAEPMPKRLPFMPQRSILPRHRNFILFSAASTSYAPDLKRIPRPLFRRIANSVDCLNPWRQPAQLQSPQGHSEVRCFGFTNLDDRTFDADDRHLHFVAERERNQVGCRSEEHTSELQSRG